MWHNRNSIIELFSILMLYYKGWFLGTFFILKLTALLFLVKKHIQVVFQIKWRQVSPTMMVRL